MPRPGDVAIVHFSGAAASKRRPVVVLSSDAYHAERPDVVLGVVTTNIAAATTASDCIFRDWKQAGLTPRPPFDVTWEWKSHRRFK